LTASVVSLSTKNYGTSQTKLLPISTEVIVRLAEFAEFEEYLAKHGKNSNLEDRED
jgi:hypothetical protein